MANSSGSKKATLLPEAFRLAIIRFFWRLWGTILALSGIALWPAFLTYNPEDASLNSQSAEAPTNLLWYPGSYAADFLLQGVGAAAFLLPLIFVAWGWRIASLKGMTRVWLFMLMAPVAIILTAVGLAGLGTPNDWPINAGLGGFLGNLLYINLIAFVPVLTSEIWISYLTIGILGGFSLFLTGWSMSLNRSEWGSILRAFAWCIGLIGKGVRKIFGFIFKRRGATLNKKTPLQTSARPQKSAKRAIKPAAKPKKGSRSTRERQPTLDLGDKKGSFSLPTLELLAEPKTTGGEQLSKEALEENARLLESVLDDFGIKGEVVEVRPGPVVTLYELEPAPGTKSSRVISLADDIARSMSAVAARVAVIPGRNAIGIELPNSSREIVYLRELLESAAFEKNKGQLPLALGKDIGGAPVIADLAGMPHLLIAGTTGSGKSVGVNAMILSLLYRLTPDQCRFIMVDPKMLELSVYDGIPHLLTPVVTEPKKAVVALKWAVREMEERYRAMSKLGVRNIAAYNKRVEEAKAKGETITRRVQTGFDRETGQPIYEDQEFDLEALPLIVIVIDEMADLMLVAGKEVEATVQRLAQMARAAGLHVIMATQRPSVDVITGTIKANFPTRIGFQVTSKIDSRTILGEQGAEQLLGKGDMLHMAGGGRITRVHGPFVDDPEVEAVVRHLKECGTPEYLADVTEEPAEGFDSPFIPNGEGNGSGSDNELYDKAVDIVLRDRKASTSYIQRRLRIGYNRAATLIDEMEANGVISSADHAGRREVLGPEPQD